MPVRLYPESAFVDRLQSLRIHKTSKRRALPKLVESQLNQGRHHTTCHDADGNRVETAPIPSSPILLMIRCTKLPGEQAALLESTFHISITRRLSHASPANACHVQIALRPIHKAVFQRQLHCHHEVGFATACHAADAKCVEAALTSSPPILLVIRCKELPGARADLPAPTRHISNTSRGKKPKGILQSRVLVASSQSRNQS